MHCIQFAAYNILSIFFSVSKKEMGELVAEATTLKEGFVLLFIISLLFYYFYLKLHGHFNLKLQFDLRMFMYVFHVKLVKNVVEH